MLLNRDATVHDLQLPHPLDEPPLLPPRTQQDFVAPVASRDPIAVCLTSMRIDLTASCQVGGQAGGWAGGWAGRWWWIHSGGGHSDA